MGDPLNSELYMRVATYENQEFPHSSIVISQIPRKNDIFWVPLTITLEK